MGFLEGLGKVLNYVMDETVKTSDRQLSNVEAECKKRGIDPNTSEKYRNQKEATETMKEKGYGKR